MDKPKVPQPKPSMTIKKSFFGKIIEGLIEGFKGIYVPPPPPR